ncbi:hypothetical protein CCHR01_04886 [Colletotrichum chrysophilum]|uniref:Uncharacterized protein n=1 Tax=Colletotrichum chrysophilum TaxID=1836956 RepID=A0AAD9AQ73_9PEZI|nr:hypothetical protein CCHR01_04886 [Colletotrichum chrysophilum]
MLVRLVVQRLMVHVSAGWLVLGWLGAANVINLVRECSDSSGKQHLPLSSVSRGAPSTRKSNGRRDEVVQHGDKSRKLLRIDRHAPRSPSAGDVFGVVLSQW